MVQSIPISDFKDLAKIYTKRIQNRNPAVSKLQKINALDTETHNGDIFLIADSDGLFLDKITPKSVMKFLFSRKYHGAWNFFYNLSYDAEVILKLLDSELYRYRITGNLEFNFENYKIKYFPNKMLKIKKGHHSVLFYDIAQFFGSSLVVAYQNNIGKLDDSYLEIKNNRSQFSKRFYNHNKKKIRSYCIEDCNLTKQLAEKWVKLFHDAFSFYPAKWFSSGYLAEKVLINNGIYFPKFNSIPYPVQELAFKSYFGGRFEMIQRGYIGKAHLYDINSAYPAAISQIPDLSNGKWVRRKSIHFDAKMGFFHVLADIPDDFLIAPFPFRANGQIIFPTGQFETFVTLAELQAFDSKYYKILDSWQFLSKSNEFPYKDFIESMYQKRLKLKEEANPLQIPIKIILNSIYGKTGQKVTRIMGNLFNPVLFSFITGFTRAKMYDFVRKNDLENEVVAFATDSICTTKKLSKNSKKLGDFEFVGRSDDTFYLQNGFYRFFGKWKQRGLGKLGSKEIEHLETFENDGKLFYKFFVNRNTRLKSSILQNKISEIGKIKEISREININGDSKRFWLQNLSEIGFEKNISVPVSLSFIKKSII